MRVGIVDVLKKAFIYINKVSEIEGDRPAYGLVFSNLLLPEGEVLDLEKFAGSSSNFVFFFTSAIKIGRAELFLVEDRSEGRKVWGDPRKLGITSTGGQLVLEADEGYLHPEIEAPLVLGLRNLAQSEGLNEVDLILVAGEGPLLAVLLGWRFKDNLQLVSSLVGTERFMNSLSREFSKATAEEVFETLKEEGYFEGDKLVKEVSRIKAIRERLRGKKSPPCLWCAKPVLISPRPVTPRGVGMPVFCLRRCYLSFHKRVERRGRRYGVDATSLVREWELFWAVRSHMSPKVVFQLFWTQYRVQLGPPPFSQD